MATSVNEPLAISPEQAAQRLGVSRATVYSWIKTGRIPTVRFPGANRILVPVKSLERLMNPEGAR